MSDDLRNWLTLELDRRRLSIRELARQADISHALVSKVLAGKMPPSADFCLKVARALGESPDWLLRLAGLLPPAANVPDDDPLVRELLEIVRRLSPEDRREILQFARFRYSEKG